MKWSNFQSGKYQRLQLIVLIWKDPAFFNILYIQVTPSVFTLFSLRSTYPIYLRWLSWERASHWLCLRQLSASLHKLSRQARPYFMYDNITCSSSRPPIKSSSQTEGGVATPVISLGQRCVHGNGALTMTHTESQDF